MISPNIISRFAEISRQITDDLGQVITLYFRQANLTSVAENPVAPFGMSVFDQNGFPQESTDLPGHANMAGANLKQGFDTTAIKGRVYWIEDNRELSHIFKGTNILTNEKVIRIVFKMTDLAAVKQADYIVITARDGSLIRAQALPIKDPIPYGLADNVQAITYWKTV